MFTTREPSETRVDKFDALVPDVSGDAKIYGFASWLIDEEGPLTCGFLAR